ncbi:MAG: glycosyltransferase [Metallibacterium scheffleri]|jgi:GT2 family glycosyltransferase|uniref:glycosyltransferase n=1 Tax=Metallibacterium scheffleri TaxID=993689 RepID=UPI0026EB7BEA|nr:glycosyltransferase [Metallibacterium scheffleri]MCK9366948.1 glycosyltransferase [Metallibacterium scheffleri]
MTWTEALTWRVRRLLALLQRARGSVLSRGWRGTWWRILQELKGSPPASSQPHLLPLDWTFAPFALPNAGNPDVSVIIPVHGHLAHTLACLRSIAACGDKIAFEVIVVDDASPDASAATLAQIQGLRLLGLPRNLGFVGACNAGAAAARGPFLCFLNNDTQVTPGWLDALRACFEDVPDCGIAGARLLYPDGRLQECGALVFADGSAWNCGRFENPDQPRHLYRRECDYVSGAALMIPADLFREVGGFDTRYAPAYYEDTDLAFAVRAARRRVLVQPASTVIHCEGVTAGLDPEQGVKRYQVKNRAQFVGKWATALRKQAQPGTREAEASARAATGRPHLLVIESTLPDAARDSGSLRLVELLRIAGQLGWRVSLMPDDRRMDFALAARLGAIGVQVIVPANPRSWLRTHADDFTAVMLSRYAVASLWLAQVRKLAPRAQVIFDTVDLNFLRERRAAELARSDTRRADALRAHELALIAASDCTLLVSEVELALVQAEMPRARLRLAGNIHQVQEPVTPFFDRADLLFIGGFQHPPNRDAVRWFAREVLPLLHPRLPGLCLHVIGNVEESTRNEMRNAHMVFHGRVDDLRPWLERCRVSIAPLRYGAGVKGKINTAMAAGLPVVATRIAAEAMALTDGVDVLLADAPAAMAAAIERAYSDEALWQRLSRGGMNNVRLHFSRARARDVLREILDDALRRSASSSR